MKTESGEITKIVVHTRLTQEKKKKNATNDQPVNLSVVRAILI